MSRQAGAVWSATGEEVTGSPGALNFSLTAVSAKTLCISISPVNDEPPSRIRELGIVDRQWQKPIATSDDKGTVPVAWGKYTLEIGRNPLRITARENGKIRQEIQFQRDSTNIHFRLDGPVFGLGEGVPSYDLRGTQDAMANGEGVPGLATFGARLPIPWVISPSGWGLFIGQPSGDFAFTHDEGIFRCNEATSTRNVFLILGDTPAEVMSEYAGLTGFPHMPPLWSLGYQQSHRTLSGRDEVLNIAKTFREKRLPCDALIYLGTGFCPSGWNTGHGSFTFNDEVFPDPDRMLSSMHESHFQVILHMVPPGNLHGEISDTGADADTPGDEAAYWKRHLPLMRLGVDGWWPDEGDRLSVSTRFERNRMYWDGPLQFQPDKRPFALHRNGYAGMQRFGWLWSGDTLSTWKALKAQITNGINVGLCGIPYWGTDTGGFVPTLEYTPELYVRWFQFSSFCPSFRSHGRAWKLHLPWGWNTGTAEPKEVTADWISTWPPPEDLHRADVEEICRKFLNLRYQLMPYLYSCVARTHSTGLPLIRALWVEFPKDEQTFLIDDSYMWGDSFLVAPVYQKQAKERSVYLPEGAWWNFWSNERIEGRRQVNSQVSLDTIPLFVKAGSIVPIGPLKQYTNEPNDELITLRVYPGAAGAFTWFEDDGYSFGYEKGKCLRVQCDWNDSVRTLTLTFYPANSTPSNRQIRVELPGGGRAQTLTLGNKVTKIQL
jgi:alpha-glucosidase/alpha-D-xyloside xylohydrolase